MRRRPLVWLAGAWITGILAAHRLQLPPLPLAWWLAALLLLSLVLVGYLRKRSGWPWTLLAMVTLTGALFYSQNLLPMPALYARLDQLEEVQGVVVDYPTQRADRSAFLLKPRDYPGRLQVFYYHKTTDAWRRVRYGDELVLIGQFEVPWTTEDSDYRGLLWARDVWGIASVWSAKQIKHLKSDQGDLLLAWGYRTQLTLFALIDNHLDAPEGSLLKSLLFGERAYLSAGIQEDFRDAGLMHVLAVSGLNLGILVSLFWIVLRGLRLSISRTYLILLPIVLIYLILTGFQVSLMRAALAFGFIALGTVLAERGLILKRWADPLQGLAAAALVILIISPKALFDVSFQLSFAATAGLLVALGWVTPAWQRYRQALRRRRPDSRLARWSLWLAEALLFAIVVSSGAQLAVAPFLAAQFHRVYLTTLLANLVVIPLVTLITWAGTLFLGLAALPLGVLAHLAADLLALLLGGLIALTGFFAAMPGAYFMIERDTWLNLLVLLPLLLSPSNWVAAQRALDSLGLQPQWWVMLEGA
jgi:competence protein ComEC